MASIPKTPMVFFSIPAPASTVSDASAMMPPTTGTTPEMAALATFTVALSAEPEMIRTTERYTVNTSSAVVRTQVTSFFSPSAMAPSRFSGRQADAVSRPI